MKGSIVAAMIVSAVAASAATIYALKKAHDKKMEAVCNCDDLPEGGCALDDALDDEDEMCCCGTDADKSSDDTPVMHCADGVCSLESDDETDQPMEIQMPTHLEEPDDQTDETTK